MSYARQEGCSVVPRNSGGMDGWKEASLMRWAFPFCWVAAQSSAPQECDWPRINHREKRRKRLGRVEDSSPLIFKLSCPRLISFFAPATAMRVQEKEGAGTLRNTKGRRQMSGSVTFWVGHPSDNAPIQLQIRWMSYPAVASPYKEERREITTVLTCSLMKSRSFFLSNGPVGCFSHL